MSTGQLLPARSPRVEVVESALLPVVGCVLGMALLYTLDALAMYEALAAFRLAVVPPFALGSLGAVLIGLRAGTLRRALGSAVVAAGLVVALGTGLVIVSGGATRTYSGSGIPLWFAPVSLVLMLGAVWALLAGAAMWLRQRARLQLPSWLEERA